jgi:hypothetical protein
LFCGLLAFGLLDRSAFGPFIRFALWSSCPLVVMAFGPFIRHLTIWAFVVLPFGRHGLWAFGRLRLIACILCPFFPFCLFSFWPFGILAFFSFWPFGLFAIWPFIVLAFWPFIVLAFYRFGLYPFWPFLVSAFVGLSQAFYRFGLLSFRALGR